MAGKLKKLTEEQAEEAVILYEAGDSLGQIAQRFAVSRQGMWDLLRRRTAMRPRLRFGAANHFYRGGARGEDRAHNVVEKAILRGRLVRPDRCDSCGAAGDPFADGRAPIQAHHDDYNQALAVRWLCQRCHHEWHKTHEAIPMQVADA